MVAGIAETKEKILLRYGNVKGVQDVEDNMVVTNAEADAQLHKVVSGDTLSKIAKDFMVMPIVT